MEQATRCVSCAEAGVVVCERCGEPACQAHGPTPQQAWCRLCQRELDSEIELRTFAVRAKMGNGHYLGYWAQGPTVGGMSTRENITQLVLKCTHWTILRRFQKKTPEEIKAQREGAPGEASGA